MKGAEVVVGAHVVVATVVVVETIFEKKNYLNDFLLLGNSYSR
jgi:hypothetical protein